MRNSVYLYSKFKNNHIGKTTMKNKNQIHEFQVTVTGYQNNGVPVSMDMLVHAKTETAAMFKAEDILMNTYGIDNAITESIQLNRYENNPGAGFNPDECLISWTYFTGSDYHDDEYGF